ncbi:ATP-dependent Clp protease adaptor ClpS [Plebeiibacterium marinum]|uniref:ATP-dependent Clp protease adaptor ClpS n=1 Tax=Plebeiibacterium marinum TaxID=2992111 RepID=A0AAE3SJZ1_9BACT|nr:ATP-dependent Clp protease adaptor ClpS [Plebeiobacterium marinum]MCW3805958.1 ATP-dependent Clp protease adaptor ClpS [Plebeiobacterium marinum]
MDSFGKKWKSDHLSKGKESIKSLVLHNDNVNSFEFVIEALVDVCNHDDIQAEQCAFLTHFTGRCQVKRGTKQELTPIKQQLANKNLSVTID